MRGPVLLAFGSASTSLGSPARRHRRAPMARGKHFNDVEMPQKATAMAAAAAAAASTSAKERTDGGGSFTAAPVNTTDEAMVDTYGPIIPGEHKWLGAAVGDDGNIYGVPAHNRRAVRVVPGTGEVTELGTDEVLGTRKYKYLRGIRTKAGTVLGIPAWADSVLEITPATGEVRTFGELPLGKWMWHGAAAGLDGNIYAIPSNADAVLKVDPVTREVTQFGQGQIPAGQNKWYGGIRGPDGAIYGIPYTANHVLKIVPETQEVIMLGDFSDVSGVGGLYGVAPHPHKPIARVTDQISHVVSSRRAEHVGPTLKDSTPLMNECGVCVCLSTLRGGNGTAVFWLRTGASTRSLPTPRGC